MARKGVIYTITVDVYAFHLAFSTILHCILHHFALRFAPKRLAFSIKTHSILHQNASHLAAKRIHLAPNSPETGVNGGLFK